MKRSVSIWWCGVHSAFYQKEKCAYHAPEMGCEYRTVYLDEEILAEMETL